MDVWSRIPKGFICEFLMNWGHCECVVIPLTEEHSISMLLLLCHYEDQYAHTHTLYMYSYEYDVLWCLLKGELLYAPLHLIMHAKCMISKV